MSLPFPEAHRDSSEQSQLPGPAVVLSRSQEEEDRSLRQWCVCAAAAGTPSRNQERNGFTLAFLGMSSVIFKVYFYLQTLETESSYVAAAFGSLVTRGKEKNPGAGRPAVNDD